MNFSLVDVLLVKIIIVLFYSTGIHVANVLVSTSADGGGGGHIYLRGTRLLCF